MSVAIDLAGRCALVAGGSGGIGSAVARRLAGAGARVATLDLAGAPPPEDAAAFPCDLADPAEAATAVAAAVAHLGGRLHVVVHAAGIRRDGVFWRLSDDDWDGVLRVNLGSAFVLLRATTPVIRRTGGGSIVLVSSINGARGKFGQANYAASKAGMEALARTAARETGRFGIRVNAVAPGFVDTAMTSGLDPELRRRAAEESVLGRVAVPDDVADAVLFLASDLARHVTGQVLRVDGGQHIG